MPWILALTALLAVGLFGPLHRPKCPDCGAPASRVISFGLPMWFCFGPRHEYAGESCPLAFGWVSRLLGAVLPWDGRLFIVPGPYLPGLWRWWAEKGGIPDDEAHP